jgi:hypothetical protein
MQAVPGHADGQEFVYSSSCTATLNDSSCCITTCIQRQAIAQKQPSQLCSGVCPVSYPSLTFLQLCIDCLFSTACGCRQCGSCHVTQLLHKLSATLRSLLLLCSPLHQGRLWPVVVIADIWHKWQRLPLLTQRVNLLQAINKVLVQRACWW